MYEYFATYFISVCSRHILGIAIKFNIKQNQLTSFAIFSFNLLATK